ncbi:MAG: Zn-ribbon domain-containing OB-fold protein [Acidilobaceae archaeon]|nr:Zn-ribbon domain-containing OB-fold protein [Acidilobaceae archaeon]MCX8165956.1 Zn-ribbon domain-containing OB-fold protein [Acidilobaceae archaeon]MDW7974599.1 Zn-ribbon domain-containing OB-fold protein [Sulfolobales archaeon]
MVRTPPVVWRSRVHRYRLVGSKCKSCGEVYYPKIFSCPCGGEAEEVELPKVGRLISYSVVYAVDEESRDRSPVIVGLIDLGVTRLVGEIVDVTPEEVKSGMHVEAVFRRIGEAGERGVIVYGLKFRPVM